MSQPTTESFVPALGLESITKSFPGVLALRDVSVAFHPGRVHAICGENGAGKSTLIKIATGALVADAGTLRVAGDRIDRPTRRRLQARGVRAIFQERQVAPDLSIVENVLLDSLPKRWGRIDWGIARRSVIDRLEILEIDLDVDTPTRSLSVAQLQLMEIARAVSFDARVLVMDEPTASLGRHEVEPLFRVVRRLRDAGVAVLFISHHLDEVAAVADDVTVMRDGAVVAHGGVEDLDADAIVREMFGRTVDVGRVDRRVPSFAARPVLAIEGVTSARLRDVNIRVGAGEIVAVTGGVGAGVSELALIASGAVRPLTGTVRVAARNGQTVRTLNSRRAALFAHVAFLPADRKRQGLLLERSVADNVGLAHQAKGRSIVTTPSAVRARARGLCGRANVKCANVDVTVGTLSGGNQQKAMIGRWMGVESDLLIFDEPTAGIDIASKFEIYAEIRRLADDGAAVLLCSTDFQEVGQVADRVVVLRSGSVIGEVDGTGATEHELLRIEMAT